MSTGPFIGALILYFGVSVAVFKTCGEKCCRRGGIGSGVRGTVLAGVFVGVLLPATRVTVVWCVAHRAGKPSRRLAVIAGAFVVGVSSFEGARFGDESLESQNLVGAFAMSLEVLFFGLCLGLNFI